MKIFLQQGDVLIKSVDAIPAEAKEIPDHHGILADGEATGHHHRVAEGAVMELNGQKYLSLGKDQIVTHEEHGEVTIPKGDYQIDIVKETDHFKEEIRRVRD